MRHNPRSAFTLVELLVVITILLILSTLVFAVFNTGRSSDRLRSAARIAQSAFLGAKDRALHAKDLRGIRLTRDATNTSLVNGFVFIQSLGNLSYATGSIQLERLDMDNNGFADSSDVLVIRGNSAPTTPTVDFDVKTAFFSSPARIRIPSQTGQWYTFSTTTTGPYALSASNECLLLQSSFSGTPDQIMPNVVAYLKSNTVTSSCDIQLLNDLLPFHQPITLSSAVVIDLRFSSANVQSLATNSNIDVMFSPRGAVSGYIAGLGPMHFLLRDLKDATATANFQIQDASSNNVACGGLIVGPDVRASTAVGYWGTQDPNQNDRLILTVFPQTGLVQIFEIDPTDKVNNYTGAATPDGLADNLFNFAQQGKAAGR